MLVIQPTADGRLRIFNNHRSDYARDESSARTLAYNWGHTDISINKALSEMRSATRGEAQPSGWRVTRADAAPVAESRPRARKVATAVAAAPAPAPAAAPAVKKAAAPKPAPNTVLAPVKPAAPAPKTAAKPAVKAVAKAAEKPVAKAAEKPAVKAVAKAPVKPRAKAAAKREEKPPVKAVVKAVRKEPVKSAPRAAPKEPVAKADPRERALSHLRAGVRELAGIEEATLAFARAPWSELREMAEYVTACLEGKKPKTGWERK